MNEQHPTGARRGTVLFLGTDGALSDALVPHLLGHGLTLETLQTPAHLNRRVQGPDQSADQNAAQSAAPDPRPVLVLIDLRAFPGTEVVAGFGAGGTTDQGPRLPLACLGQAGDLPQRLAAMRAGAAVWLAADLDPADLAARLAALVGPADGAPERILVVDDQPVSALFAARVLEGAGMVTQQVADPLLVLSALDCFAPDLVLMDLHMPGVSGIELTEVIREQERFADLPIVFLSVELDPERQLEALRVGGDDFLAKPVSPGRLVACVRTRLARARMHQRTLGRGAAVASDALAGDRERLFARLDRLLRTPAGAEWALVYLEQPGDAADLTRLVAAVCATACAASGAQVARVGEHGVGALVRGGPERGYAAAAEALAQAVRADLAAGAAGAAAPRLGIGWCAIPAGGGESVTLVSRARKAARVSLQGRQGRVEGYLHTTAGAGAAGAGAATETDPVLAAIAAGRFQLLFQPMVPLIAVPAERYEATLRLAGPQGELLALGDFVPVARRAGQSAPIDRWLLTAGLDALRQRRIAGRPVELVLHQSLAGAAEHDWVTWVRDEINTRDLIQCRPIIQFELADADANLDLAIRRAEQLDRLRIRLCLNGFVVGDRAREILEQLPVTYVRLARPVIRDLSSPGLQDLVNLVHDRKAQVIATGIEGPEAIAPLYRVGIDLIQGPYVQPPAEAMDFDFADAVG